jgi:hypothetical protein
MNPLPRPLKLRVALGTPGDGEWGFNPPFHEVAVEAEDLAEVRLRVRFPPSEGEPPPEVRVTVVKDR